MSPQATLIGRLGDLMYVISAAVFVLVVAALIWAVVRRRHAEPAVEDPARERRMSRTVAAATVATVVVLVVMSLLSFATGSRLTAAPRSGAIQIAVTGYQWWWHVEYQDSVPQRWATTANEIHVPVGRPVVLELRADDVIHSFWIPKLAVKRDMIPGKVTSIWFQADSAGVYRGQCAEFCGHQHAKMAFLVIAEEPDKFAAWLETQRDTAATPAQPNAARGEQVFLASSCVMCHAVGGTPAGSRVGPNLTHLASRRTLAAGTLPNTRGHLGGWILDPQTVKPGVRMPATTFEGDEFEALLDYLGSLQ